MALGAMPSTIGKMNCEPGRGSWPGIGVGIGLLLSGIMAPLISSLLLRSSAYLIRKCSSLCH